jgi:hypothetical protein
MHRPGSLVAEGRTASSRTACLDPRGRADEGRLSQSGATGSGLREPRGRAETNGGRLTGRTTSTPFRKVTAMPLVVLLIVIALAVLGPVWGVDSRGSHDPCDRFWWPNG